MTPCLNISETSNFHLKLFCKLLDAQVRYMWYRERQYSHEGITHRKKDLVKWWDKSSFTNYFCITSHFLLMLISIPRIGQINEEVKPDPKISSLHVQVSKTFDIYFLCVKRLPSRVLKVEIDVQIENDNGFINTYQLYTTTVVII